VFGPGEKRECPEFVTGIDSQGLPLGLVWIEQNDLAGFENVEAVGGFSRVENRISPGVGFREAVVREEFDVFFRQSMEDRDAAMVKVYCSEMLNKVADDTVQIFGGMGVCQDTMIPEVFTIGRFCRIADGPDEVHMSQLGKLTARELTP